MNSESKPPLVPYPKEVTIKKGYFDLSKAAIIYESYDSDAAFMAETIAKRCIEACGMEPSICVNTSSFDLKVVYKWDDTLGEEEYILIAEDKKVVISASSKQGRWYGAMTLCQLINKDGKVKCLEIRDYPDYKIRAFSDDISRGQVSNISHFKKIIRFCSEYKINHYVLYIEDMFQFKSNRRIGIGRGALTYEEVRELVDYSRVWHVDIIPLFESLGHQNIMVGFPEYKEFREREGSFSFSPTDERTIHLMEDFYKELSCVFSSPYIFAGLDETTDIGTGKTKKDIEEKGHAKVYSEYYNALSNIAKKLGKKLWIYGTLAIDFPEALDNIDKDIIMVNYTFFSPNTGDKWWDNLYNYIPIIRQKGFNEVVSPSIWNWEKIFPNYKVAYETTKDLNKIGYNNGCIGTMIASWCDDGGENFRENNWYGYGFQSELSWNATLDIDEEDFAPRFGNSFFGQGGEKMASIIKLLGNMENGIDIYKTLYDNEIFSKDISEKEKIVNKKMKDMEYIDRLWKEGGNPYVKRNAEAVKFVDFARRKIKYVFKFVKRVEELNCIKENLKNEDKIELHKEAVDILNDLYNNMEGLIGEFEGLWRRYNRIEGLDYNLSRMERHLSLIDKEISYFLNDTLKG